MTELFHSLECKFFGWRIRSHGLQKLVDLKSFLKVFELCFQTPDPFLIKHLNLEYKRISGRLRKDIMFWTLIEKLQVRNWNCASSRRSLECLAYSWLVADCVKSSALCKVFLNLNVSQSVMLKLWFKPVDRTQGDRGSEWSLLVGVASVAFFASRMACLEHGRFSGLRYWFFLHR